MRVFKLGNLVAFFKDATPTGALYPNGIVAMTLPKEVGGNINFVNIQNGMNLRDEIGKSLSAPFADIKKEDGTAYGATQAEVVIALASIVNFSSVIGGGGSAVFGSIGGNIDDQINLRDALAGKTPFAYVDNGLALLKGAPPVALDTLQKIAAAVDNDAAFATTIANALATKATPADISAAIAALLDSSPAALDTLNELAAALGDDPNFATTVMTAMGLRELLSNKATNFLIVDDQYYPTTKAVSDLLTGFVTAAALTTTLANYVTSSMLTSTLAGYASLAQLSALDPRFDGYVRALMSFAGNTTATTIPAAGTYVKIAGTTTDGGISNNVTVSNGRLTYTGTANLSAPNLAKMVTMFGSIQGANNTTLSVGIAKSGVMLSQFVQNIRITTANVPMPFMVRFPLALVQNNFLEPYGANLTNGSAFTVTNLTFSL